MTSLLPSQQDAARELLRRREARAKLLPFVQYVKPDYEPGWHHEVLCEHLDKFVSGEIKRLMVFMPPQHGKSELVSRKLPAFIFGNDPDVKIVAASYAASLIEGMNREVQRTIDSPEYHRLFPEVRLNESNIRTVSGNYLRNNEIFEIVGRRGQYKCAGVGGGLTGTPGDIGLIDDPFKDYEEAKSKTIRDKVWEWYTSVFLARTHKRSRLLVTQTRWHEDDLAGRLLDKEGHLWTVLKLPAICEKEDEPHETRSKGEALWPARFDLDTLLSRRALNTHQFEALYQQNPSPKEGSFFKVERFQWMDKKDIPANMRWVRAWDIGATEGAGDPTAGVKMGTDGKIFIVADCEHGQWGTDTRNAKMRHTAEMDARECKVRVPQDPGAAGKDMALAMVRLLAGFNVVAKLVSGDKETRADPYSAQVNAGNVFIVRDEEGKRWNAEFVEEHRQFPNGTHDDRIDAASDAFNELATPDSVHNSPEFLSFLKNRSAPPAPMEKSA